MELPESVRTTAQIASAYVSSQHVPTADLPGLIASIHKTIVDLAEGRSAAPAEDAKREPAVNPKKSIFPDYIVCLDDGRKFKSLKRHLATLDMTPEQYRAKWGLPANYPMVAPAYAKQRSELAKSMGLGRKG